MWVIEAVMILVEIVVDLFDSKKDKSKGRKRTGKRYSK